jgi:N-methylhydantoinase B
MRAMIRRIPDGHYSFEDFLDEDGITPEPIRIHTAIDVKGDEMEIDLSGCGPQAIGPVNATYASSASAIYYAVLAVADQSMAVNAGCYRPIRIKAPKGLIVNPQHPAPVANRIAVSHRLATTMFGALHQAVPGRVPAAYYGVSYVCSFQTMSLDGSRNILVEIEVGGTGAYQDQDGVSAWAFGMHNNASIPVEMIEADIPLTVMGYGLLDGSAGKGRQRGGLGLFREWRVDSPEACFTANLERFNFQPYGLNGGETGRAGKLWLIRADTREPLPSKVNNLTLYRGDVIRLETSGGGGYGPAAEREQAAILLDKIGHYA